MYIHEDENQLDLKILLLQSLVFRAKSAVLAGFSLNF